MARAALRDDLFSLHADLTADVLRSAAGGRSGRGRRGAARRPGSTPTARPVERCLAILGEIRTGGTYDLTTLPVALRELRNLSRAAGAV